MPSTPYDLVHDDHDLRIPLHAEQAFFHGITFQAKLIGWQEVPRPNSRTEIVHAMRRIRKKQWIDDIDYVELASHPIYRIFYVSHDSSDLKIFSYIARDGSADTFKCSVFKSTEKSQAMRIVRTIGQAFEVCHKFNLQNNSMSNADDQSIESQHELFGRRSTDQISNIEEIIKEPTPQTSSDSTTVSHFNSTKSGNVENIDDDQQNATKSKTEIQQLREQLEQQASQTRRALSQLMLIREQLISETNARIEAQTKTQQLLQQNRELLDHLASLGGFSYPEIGRPGIMSTNISLSPQSPVFQFDSKRQSEEHGSKHQRFIVLPPDDKPNITALTEQLHNLETINQQLRTLNQQLDGLTQQSRNLEQFESIASTRNSMNQLLTNGSSTTSTMRTENNSNAECNSSARSLDKNEHRNVDNILMQTDLFRSDQMILNRSKKLCIDLSNTDNNNRETTNNNKSIINNNISKDRSNSYNYNQREHCSSFTNLNINEDVKNWNVLSSPNMLSDSTPHLQLKNSVSIDDSSVSDKTSEIVLNAGDETNSRKSIQSATKIKMIDNPNPIIRLSSSSFTSTEPSNRSSGSTITFATPTGSGSIRKIDKRVTLPDFSSHIKHKNDKFTNSKRVGCATPITITRTSSEKVSGRSQIMNEVNRMAWARHTTK